MRRRVLMLGKKTNWEVAEQLISKDNTLPQQAGNRSQMSREGRFIESPNGLISRVQSEQIKNKAGLEFDRKWYEAQLEVSKHQLKRAVELKIKETDADIERLLTDISRRHLQYLTEMGLRNSEQREEALEQLSDQTAARIKRLQGKDWPESLIEQTINGVIELHQRFFDKILAD
jgi:hypothetical protein